MQLVAKINFMKNQTIRKIVVFILLMVLIYLIPMKQIELFYVKVILTLTIAILCIQGLIIKYKVKPNPFRKKLDIVLTIVLFSAGLFMIYKKHFL
ncbi:MAG: hypothetical protein DI539_15765 [Flavobacterium psychrophilum]|nr:MAG: hypothetical protein DI539_15765 [Flavobacterium psychrophilum]